MSRDSQRAWALVVMLTALASSSRVDAKKGADAKTRWLRGYWAQLAGGVAFNRPALPPPNGADGEHEEVSAQAVFAGGVLLGPRLALGVVAQHEVWAENLVVGGAGAQIGLAQPLGAGFALGVELGVGKLWSGSDEIAAAGAWRSWSNLRLRWAPWPRWGEWGLAVVLSGGVSIDYGLEGPKGFSCNDSCWRPQVLLGVEMTTVRWGVSVPARGQSRKTCPRSPMSTDVDSRECVR